MQSLLNRRYGYHIWYFLSRTSYQEFLFHWGWYTAQNVDGYFWGWSSACSNSPVKSGNILLSQTLDMVISILVMSIKSVSMAELNDQYGAFSLKVTPCPGWCGSVDWVPACEPKGHQFDSQSRAHAWVACQVPGWGHMRGKHTLMFFSISFSLPSPFFKNK